MSKYGWEKGTLKIPGGEWKRVRDELVAAHNKHRESMHQLSVAVHTRLTALKSSKGAGVLSTELSELLRNDPGSAALLRQLDNCEDAWEAVHCVRKFDPQTRKTTLVAPKKKDFAPVPPTKAKVLHYGEFSVSFDATAKTITWSVSDNNHSVDRAHDHNMGRTFFRVMSSVKWVRGTGGQIVGNDENNRDNDEEGGGSNYVTHRFGPMGGDLYKELGLRRPSKVLRPSRRF
jgi:hypothetical protein